MGGYGYEIIGGLLIVLSSLVGEQMKPKWKVGFYLLFAAVAIAYSGIGIHLRREANIREETQRQEHKNELKGVRQDLSNMLSAFSGLGPSVASLNADVAIMRRDLETAKQKHDPRAIAELEARTSVAQQRVDNASKVLLIAMVPGTIRQLRSWNGSWSSTEGRALIDNADYLRRALLQGLQETPEDVAASILFVNIPTNWDAERAARYLEGFIRRLNITLPVTNFSATVQ